MREAREVFIFVAQENIKLKEIYFSGEQLELKKGERITFNLSTYTPYYSNPMDKELNESEEEVQFNALKTGDDYSVNIGRQSFQLNDLTYYYKDLKFSIKFKDEYDVSTTIAMP